MDRSRLLFLALIFEGGLLVLAFALGWLGNSSPLERFYLSWESLGWGILGSFPLLIALWMTLHSSWQPLVDLKESTKHLIEHLFPHCRIIDLVIISLLAGIGEEFFFRGWMQSVLTHTFSLWPALLLTSILFGLAHFISPIYAFYTAIVSIYLGILFFIFDNLLVPITTHALYDFLALLYFQHRYSSKNPPTPHS